jgi:hypothetical protein
VTVVDTVPAGLTPTSARGPLWDLRHRAAQVVTCTRSDSLASVASYPAIMLTVNVAADAASTVTTRRQWRRRRGQHRQRHRPGYDGVIALQAAHCPRGESTLSDSALLGSAHRVSTAS